jgi:hypothetical protein
MRKVSGIILLCSTLLLAGAGCVFNNNTQLTTANYPATTTVKKDYYINRGAADNLAVPFAEWQRFFQKKYGWEFSYPEGWQIRTEKTENQLLIFLSNVACENQCPPEFVGLKMKVGAIYPGGDFLKYIKNEISRNNKAKIYPGGKVENLKISGRSAIKVSRTDWAGAEPGPGYYVGLDKDYYAYISIGRNNLTKKSESVINQLIGSIKIYNNFILRPEVLEKMAKINSGISTADDDVAGTDTKIVSSVYASRRYKFVLSYPEHCYFSDMTNQTQPPIDLELALCGIQPDERVVGVRVFEGGIDAAWMSVYNGRDLNYQMQKVLVSDTPGRMYTVSAGARSRAERWLMTERNGRTYIIYVIDDVSSYANDFDELVSGFEFN